MEELLSTKSIMTIMLAVGGIGGIIATLKDAPGKIWDLIRHKFIFSVTIYKHDKMYDHFEKWFYDNHRDKFRNVEISMLDKDENPKPIGTPESKNNIAYSQKKGYFFIKHLGAVLYIKKDKIDRKDSSQSKPFLDFYVVEGFNKKAVNSLFSYIYDTILKNEKVHIYSNNVYGEWIAQNEVQPKTFKNVIIPEITKNLITDDIEEFLDSESWYIERGIPYNRGYMFDGVPGNGKTTLAIAIAEKYNKPVHILDLSSLNNDSSLKNCFRYIPANGIMVIEDIDAIFKKREAAEDNSGITFGCLLNCLDGVFQKHGIIVIMTTNHKELLDDALIREGRVDFNIEIMNPTKDCVERYLSNFYAQPVVLDRYELDIPMVNIQGMCIRNKRDITPVLEELTRSTMLKTA